MSRASSSATETAGRDLVEAPTDPGREPGDLVRWERHSLTRARARGSRQVGEAFTDPGREPGDLVRESGLPRVPLNPIRPALSLGGAERGGGARQQVLRLDRCVARVADGVVAGAQARCRAGQRLDPAGEPLGQEHGARATQASGWAWWNACSVNSCARSASPRTV